EFAGFDPSTYYLGALWVHLSWASTFIIHWSQLPDDERATARSDPWQLQQTMLDSGDDRSDIRNTFQFLAYPETFEPIPSANQKKQIRDASLIASADPPVTRPLKSTATCLTFDHPLPKKSTGNSTSSVTASRNCGNPQRKPP